MMRSFRALMVVGLMALLFVALHASAPRAYAATARYVNPSTGSDAGTCDNSASQCKTITYTLTQSVAGDTINLAAGTYSVSSNGETLPLGININLTITGASAATTIIDGEHARRVIWTIGVTVNLSNVTIVNGSSTDPFGGGGIANVGGTLTVTNSTFSGNSAFAGGGIYNLGTLTVTNSTFSGNSAPSGGGGIASDHGPLTVTNSTFSDNHTTGFGGGIDNSIGTLTVTNSTFSGNHAALGGGIVNESDTLMVTNSTFSGNSAPSGGGGIYNYVSGGSTTLRNTIVANSPTGGNCYGTVTDGGHNLQFGGTVANSCGAGIPTGDPVLGPLANNGGPTQTMALGAGSAALDQIPNAGGCGFGVTTDQRGIARPQPPSGLCDIGAYELVQQAPASSKPAEVPEADTLLLYGGGMGGLATWVGWQFRKRRTKK